MNEPGRDSIKPINRIFRKPWMGIVWFVGVMVVFIFLCAPLQYYLGMTGLALTELIILIMALIPTLLSGQKLSEVFPIKVPSGLKVLGVFLMWLGTFLVVLVINVVIMMVLPEAMAQEAGGLGAAFTSVSFIPALLIVAVMPAICEEALHRGFILSTMKPIRKDWVVVLIMGVLFGLFHLSVVRFAGTAILGAVLTYIMLKTKNFLYPAFLHLINNMVPLVLVFFVTEATGTNEQITTEMLEQSAGISDVMTLGSIILFACGAPILIACGAALINRKKASEYTPEEKAARGRKAIRVIVVSAVLSALIFVSGLVLMVGGMFTDMPLNINEKFELTQASEPKVYTTEITLARPYALQYNLSTDKGLIHFEILDESDKPVVTFFANEIFGNGNYTLVPGTYRVIIRVVPEDVRAYYEANGQEYPDDGFPDLPMPADENDPVQISLNLKLI